MNILDLKPGDLCFLIEHRKGPKLAWGTPGNVSVTNERNFYTIEYNLFEFIGLLSCGPEFYVVGLDRYTMFLSHDLQYLCKLTP